MNAQPSAVRFEDEEAWAELLALFANCLGHPDDRLERALEDGSLSADLDRLGNRLELDIEGPSLSESAGLTESYEALFGAYRSPFAPPAASPYKKWYEGREGLMDGPPATRMEKRFEALQADVPPSYPADHIALQLEYLSLLLEAGDLEEARSFLANELDWIDAFEHLVDAAVASAPFHRWSVSALVTAIDSLRSRLEVEPPEGERIERMKDRARTQIE
ncbi:MAG: molecular chaperone TorD family protein [Halodesulfurarchaeum sp.]